MKVIEALLGLTFAAPLITVWLPFALMGLVWSLALYLGHRHETCQGR